MSVVCHEGSSPHSGHYVSYLRDPSTQEWWHFDDLSVPVMRVVTTEEMSQDVNRNGMLFFYRVPFLWDTADAESDGVEGS